MSPAPTRDIHLPAGVADQSPPTQAIERGTNYDLPFLLLKICKLNPGLAFSAAGQHGGAKSGAIPEEGMPSFLKKETAGGSSIMECTWTGSGNQAEPHTGGLAPSCNLAASHDGFSIGGTSKPSL